MKNNFKNLDFLLEFERSITTGDLENLWFENKNLKPCWEIKNCIKKSCIAYGRKNIRCWQFINKVFCNKNSNKNNHWQSKYLECPVFQQAAPTDSIKKREILNNIIALLKIYDPMSMKSIIAKRNINEIAIKFSLTQKEIQIVLLIIDRYSLNNISEILNISKETAKVHFKNIYKKTQVHSKDELINKLFCLV